MNLIHFHLIASHVPILTAASALLAIQAGVWRQRPAWTRAGLWLVVATGAAGAVVAISGRLAMAPAIELGAPAGLVRLHEIRGVETCALVMATALLALAALLCPAPAPKNWVAGIAAATALSIGLLVWTGWRGGNIRHPEIQAGWKDTLPAKSFGE